jgi:hypothetical protein
VRAYESLLDHLDQISALGFSQRVLLSAASGNAARQPRYTVPDGG